MKFSGEIMALQLLVLILLADAPNYFKTTIVYASVSGGNSHIPLKISSTAFIVPKNPNSSLIPP